MFGFLTVTLLRLMWSGSSLYAHVCVVLCLSLSSNSRHVSVSLSVCLNRFFNRQGNIFLAALYFYT